MRVAGGRGRGRERADEDAVRHDDAGPRRVGLGRERVELGPPRLDETRTDGQRRGAPRDGRRAADGGEVDRRRLRASARRVPRRLSTTKRAALRVRVEQPERRARGDRGPPPRLREAPPGHVVAEAAAVERAVGARRGRRRRLEAAEVGRAEQREHLVREERRGAGGVDAAQRAGANAGAAPTRRGRRLRCGGPRGVGRAATSAENGRAASQAASSRLLAALLPPSSMTFAPRVDIVRWCSVSNW